MSTNLDTDSAVLVMITTIVGVYVWVMRLLLEMFAAWVTAGSGALLRYAGYL
jgi:hypothetical protein